MRLIGCFISLAYIVSSSCIAYADLSTDDNDLRNVIGVTHAAGRYNFTKKDFLNEGADQILKLGTKVIKLWFTADPAKAYPFNSKWKKPKDPVELAKSKYYRRVFAKPFTTFILETYPPGKEWSELSKGMTQADIDDVEEGMYTLAKYLLREYKGTGKTFILQNWETDWALWDTALTKEPDQTAIQAMIDFLNARQDGVERARQEIGMDGVIVVHAAEVNAVTLGMSGKTSVINNVVPYTHCDLYSYSVWDTTLDPEQFRKALYYIAKKTPPSKMYGSRNIYIGEYGAAENKVGGPEKQLEITKSMTEIALKFGARYIVYWQLYCDGSPENPQIRPRNSDCAGYWLVLPDGSKSLVWDYFKRIFDENRSNSGN